LPQPLLYPVFLSGGGGSRLWPLSRGERPKQFLRLSGDRTLFQQALARASDRNRFASPIVVSGATHAGLIGEQLAAVGLEADLVLEPFGRDTAAAVTTGLLEAARRDPDAVALVMPTDQSVRRPAAFLAAVETAAGLASSDRFVLFGVTPDGPNTGYGYVRRGAPLEGAADAWTVGAFVEKPDAARAETLLAEGCLWNSGMFLLPAKAALDEIERLAPEVYAAAKEAWSKGVRDNGALRLDAEAFGRAPPAPIDRAVMEKTDRAVVLGVDLGWADLGTWSALWTAAERDAAGSAVEGPAVVRDAVSSLIRAEGLPVCAIGVEDLVIVATRDGVLVARRGRDEEVKALAAELKRAADEAGKS
jgi:mannose-1-phosphate guanylyltransferase/mannose-1-phosphate guanylyltransferase/mannose-6-phosphate isomerase